MDEDTDCKLHLSVDPSSDGQTEQLVVVANEDLKKKLHVTLKENQTELSKHGSRKTTRTNSHRSQYTMECRATRAA